MYFIKEFCLHGRLRYNKCAAVWTLKIPVSHTGVLIIHVSQNSFTKYQYYSSENIIKV